MQAPDLRLKKRSSAANARAKPSPTKVDETSPKKTATAASGGANRQRPDNSEPQQLSAMFTGKITDSATSRYSASDDRSSYVTVSPLTTPGTSHLPASRRRSDDTDVGVEDDAAAIAAALAGIAGQRERRSSGSQSDLSVGRAKHSAPKAGAVTPVATKDRSAVTSTATSPSAKSGQQGAAPVEFARTPSSKNSAGMPLSRGQLPSPHRRAAATATASTSSSSGGGGAGAGGRPQPLRRQGSSSAPAFSAPSHPSTPDAARNRTHPRLPKAEHAAAAGTNYLDQLEQMEAVMDYVDSITQALSQRTRSLPPPASLSTFRATILPSTRRSINAGTNPSGDAAQTTGSASTADEDSHYSLLGSLHDASSALLSAFSKLEYVKLSQQEPLAELERTTLQCCAKVLAVVEMVDRRFTTHEDADLRIAFRQRREVVLACQEYVDTLTQTTQQIVLLRKLTTARDLARVREVLQELKDVIQRRVMSASSPLSAKYQALMLTGPFFFWLEQRWLPAMRAWRQLVLEARQVAGNGDVEGALARSQRELVSVASLQDILRPGETLTDLHHTEIEVPINELAKTFDRKKAVMDALRQAVGDPTLEGLGKAIQASQDFSSVKSRTQQLSVEDEQCVKEAQQLLCDLQETEVVRRAMEMALQVGSGGGSALTLFKPLQRANELITRLKLAQSPGQADRVVRASKAALAKLASLQPSTRTEEDVLAADNISSITANVNGCGGTAFAPILAELLPPTVSPHDLSITHIPSKVWTVDVSTTYQRLCQLLTEVAMKELVRRDLERAMSGAGSGCGGGGISPSSLRDASLLNSPSRHDDDEDVVSNGRPTATSSVTTPRPGSSVTAGAASLNNSNAGGGGGVTELEELQLRVRQAEEMGLSGALVAQAKARIAQLDTIRLKVHFDAQARIIPIADPDHTPFEKIYERLFADCMEQQTMQKAVAVDQRLRIRYEDLDGDFITLLNDDDWQMMLGERAPRGHRVGVKVEVYCDFPVLPSSPRVSGSGGVASREVEGGDGGALCRSGEGAKANAGAGGNATNRSGEREVRVGGNGFTRTNSATAGTAAATQSRPGRGGGGATAGAGVGRSQPMMNNAARLRTGSRPRYGSPALTVENLTRSQSGYRSVSPTSGANALGVAKPKCLDHKNPPALVQEPQGTGATPGADVDDSVRVATPSPPPPAAPAAGNVVRLDLEAVKRWGDDDDESRMSLMELQTVASVSTVQTSRLGPPLNPRGAGANVQERPAASRLAANALSTTTATAGPSLSRFTATNCSRASPAKAVPPPQQHSLGTAKRWNGDGDTDGSGDGVFDDIHTVYSEATRPRDGRSCGTTATTDDVSCSSEGFVGTNSEKENELVGLGLGRGVSPYGKGACALATALPPRPDPNKRTGTPNRPRAQRGGSAYVRKLEEDAALHRDANDLLSEMQQLRDQNQQAMRTPTPRRAWH